MEAIEMRTLIRIFISTLSVITLLGCGDQNTPGEHNSDRPLVRDVIVEKITPQEVTAYHEASGTVKSVNTSIVSAKVMGEVRDIKVNVSDSVQKGDLLLLIHSPDTEARVIAAVAALGEAEKALGMAEKKKALMESTFNRYEKLHREKAVAEQEFDGIRTRRDVAVLEYERSRSSLKKAEASRKESESLKAYTGIRSPVNGIIADIKIDRGSMTGPGMPLIIVEEQTYRVEAAVDESMVPHITVGTPVEVLIDALGIKTAGTVGEIVRNIDPATRTFTVKINIRERIDALRGGLYSRVMVPVEKKLKLFITEHALITRGELRGVYTVNEEGGISLRIIKTGKRKEGLIEVLSGLDPGDHIIVDGVDKAVDGGRIR